MQEQYISTEELFNNIKDDFSSFDNAGMIDEGKFYKHVVYIIGLLGTEWYETIDGFFEVKNYQVKLPSNFYQLEQAYKCFPFVGQNTQPAGIILTERKFDHFPVDCEPSCNPCPPQPSNCISNKFQQLVIQRNTMIDNYTDFNLLSIGNSRTRSSCTSTCANLFSSNPDNITIQNGTMFTNFRDGSIYMVYNAFPIDEESGLPLIPNDERVIKCIEYYVKWKFMENAWVNNEADVAQKIQYFQVMYKDALGDAQYITKLPGFNIMVNKIKLDRGRLRFWNMNTTPRHNN